MKRTAIVLLALLLPACSDSENGPAETVAAFIESLNDRDWDGATSRLTKEAKALIPEDDAELLMLRAQIYAIIDKAGGRMAHREAEAVERGDGLALVPCMLTLPFVPVPVEQSVTFRLRREDGAWKLLPGVELQGGHVVENPLALFRARPKR